jgi:hypothetical protein
MSARHGIVIRVDVAADARNDAELAKKLEEICPVDIFTARNGPCRSSKRISTSACSADSAWTPRSRGGDRGQALRWRRCARE